MNELWLSLFSGPVGTEITLENIFDNLIGERTVQNDAIKENS